MIAMLVAIGKRVVVDRFRPASQHHFWDTEWITRLGLSVAVARGAHLREPPERRLNILVPVRGNKVSRHGAEVALALARAGASAVTALYVMGTVGLGAAQRRLRRPTRSRRHEKTILKDIVELADRYDTRIRTALRVDIAPEDAILRPLQRF